MSGAWFKCYPSDFLNGMGNLDPYERGIYVSVCYVLYDEGGTYPYDPKAATLFAARCGASTRGFNKAIKSLVDKGKLKTLDGYIFNKRVLKELKADFISDLTLKYLVIILPDYKEIKGLQCAKKLESRIQKKLKIKMGKKERSAPEDCGSDATFEKRVCMAYGQEVWDSWFAGDKVSVLDDSVTPKNKFIYNRIAERYSEAIFAAGLSLVVPHQGAA